MKYRPVTHLVVLAAVLAFSSSTPAFAAPTTPPTPTINYVALGDSVAAGVGVEPSQAYPALLDAASRRLNGVNEARSGASARQVAAQIAQFEADHPGKLDLVTKVTLTVGANDINLQDLVSSCLQLPDCSDIEQAVDAGLAGLASRLPLTLANIHDKFPNARIYVSGYFELFGNRNKPCALTPEISITAASMSFLNTSARRLNASIASAVAAARANSLPIRFVNVASAFNGHGLCDSARPWVLGFDNLATATHPNRYGQAAYAIRFRGEGVR